MKSGGKICLVISGVSLQYLNRESVERLMKAGLGVDGVIISRATPKQKKEVIQIVHSIHPKITSLAVGDGANDVNMIIQANIGVGIIGLEGQQAARASDYAINQFSNLLILILFHGRESYRKNSYLVHYNFYKNILLVTPALCIFYIFIIFIHNIYIQGFGIISGFSGTFLYDKWIF